MPASNERSAAPSGETCPACRGEGETPRAAERSADGVWARDTTPCRLCEGAGVVSEAMADGWLQAMEADEDV